MTQKSLTIRVENLESAVAELARLPRQMEDLSSQFLQLHEDVREEISGVRSAMTTMRGELTGEMTTMRDGLRGEMTAMREDLRGEMTAMREDLRGEMTAMRDDLRGEMTAMRDELRGEMTAMRDELRDDVARGQIDMAGAILSTEKRLSAEMRSLHEDLVQRIAIIGETRSAARDSHAATRRSPHSRKKR